jgi:hypothetical protein
MSCEPQFHFFEDCLPELDIRAYQTIMCVDCTDMVHAGNNETMQAWFDTVIGAVCLECFTKRYQSNPEAPTWHWSFDDLQPADEVKQ